MRRLIVVSLLSFVLALPCAAGTINNDDSCDIGTYPAATLLLPYFEVDLGQAGVGSTTIFSITNVSPSPQVVSVTLWTDWAFPVVTFPIFLTGYDVQAINLFDIIVRGIIGSPTGTGTGSPNARDGQGRSTNPYVGTTPLTNLANPNFLLTASADCASGRLPGQLPSPVLTDIRALLSTGRSTGASFGCPVGGAQQRVGGNHGAVAIGYVTMDVMATCSPLLPNDPRYYEQILFDNVLTGDYEQVASNPASGNYAGGNPLVHIRAIPEGGAAGSTQTRMLPFTFYDRFSGSFAPGLDRRQPLPSTFAARWISGSNAAFETSYKIWREAGTGANASCTAYSQNEAMPVAEIVRFDEHENAWVGSQPLVEGPQLTPVLAASSQRPVTFSATFPLTTSSDVGGWMYLNLNSRDSGSLTRNVSQNWVIVSMFAEGRFGVDYDATSLGNGCSPAATLSKAARDQNSASGRIGPAQNVNP